MAVIQSIKFTLLTRVNRNSLIFMAIIYKTLLVDVTSSEWLSFYVFNLSFIAIVFFFPCSSHHWNMKFLSEFTLLSSKHVILSAEVCFFISAGKNQAEVYRLLL